MIVLLFLVQDQVLSNNRMALLLQACHENIRSKYPPNVIKALDGVPYVAKHLKDADDGDKVNAQKAIEALNGYELQ